ncbi:hypothetical protein [Neorhizobium galegae]|uniref:hypothetical protein n=1 Tax=Neorhizobium galegae TaxID=399 RepID=UPI00155E0806|nr:hypothetical protein [Neorhizobium galegae]
MRIVETILKIRRLAHVQGKTIKAICRELGIGAASGGRRSEQVVGSSILQIGQRRIIV